MEFAHKNCVMARFDLKITDSKTGVLVREDTSMTLEEAEKLALEFERVYLQKYPDAVLNFEKKLNDNSTPHT